MLYEVTINFIGGVEETFTVHAENTNHAIERTNMMAMENLGYWFNTRFVDSYDVRLITDDDDLN